MSSASTSSHSPTLTGKIERAGSQSPKRNFVFGNIPTASKIDIRPWILSQDAQNQKVQL